MAWIMTMSNSPSAERYGGYRQSEHSGELRFTKN